MATEPMPMDFDPERLVLGAVLLDNSTLTAIEPLLRVEHLRNPAHRTVYAAMLTMAEAGQPIDFATLKGALVDAGELDTIGGVAFLGGLIDGLPRVRSAEAWARMIVEGYRRRAAVIIAQRVIEAASDGSLDTDVLVDRAQTSLSKLMESGERQIVKLSDVLPAAMRELDSFASSSSGVTGIPTGLLDLDQLTGGLKPGRLWVVAARFARGKSALSAQIALTAAQKGFKVLVIGMEMPPEEQAGRMLLSSAEVDKWDLRRDAQRDQKEHSYAWAKVGKVYGEMRDLPLYLDRHEAPNIAQIRAAAKSQHTSTGLDLLVVDYIQRATLDPQLVKSGGIWAGVGDVVKGLKSLARSLNIPVVAASQLNSAAQEKEPTLADFAQAQGAIGAESDVVAFLHPDSVNDFDRESAPPMHILVKKHRGGACMALPVIFRKTHTRFESAVPDTWTGEKR
jgi:replicative DNA helicase